MIITKANEVVSKIHDRMPALLTPYQSDGWLSGSAGVEVLAPWAQKSLRVPPVPPPSAATERRVSQTLSDMHPTRQRAPEIDEAAIADSAASLSVGGICQRTLANRVVYPSPAFLIVGARCPQILAPLDRWLLRRERFKSALNLASRASKSV